MIAERLAARRRYITRFIPAMASYAILLVLLMPVVRRTEASGVKILLALIPTIPVAVAILEILRFVRSLDELERRVQFEAVAVAGLLTCFLSFAWGLLESAGVPKMPVILVMPVFCAIYGFSVWLAHRRFR